MAARLIYEVDGEQLEVFNVKEEDVTLTIDKIPTMEYNESVGQYLLMSEQFKFTVYFNNPINLNEEK